ncbi:MAG: hypothetical protein JNK10_09760 [Cyclobacteriaceae bacterium]|nr:hypothetical protein [Cyclobacteriaceae bacterium]
MNFSGRVSLIKAVWLLTMVLGAISAKAQFSNEWINFGQTYYKIPVARDGIYKVTYADLVAAGISPSSIDPRRINIFHRGTEQAIQVTGQADAVFDPSDVIEFYGKRNDGTLDASLYEPSGSQPHSYYNLYSDTTAYFLTWNALPVLGKRMDFFSEVNSLSLPAESAQTHERLDLFTSEFSQVGDIQATSFGVGEGWTGTMICTVSSGCTGQQDFLVDNLTGGVPSADVPFLEIHLAGRGEMVHHAEIYAGQSAGSLRLLGAPTFVNYETSTLQVPLAWTDIAGDGKMVVRVKLTPTGVRDQASVSYLKVLLPQNFQLNAVPEKVLQLLQNPTNKSYIELLNPASGSRVWDVTDPSNVRMIGTTPFGGGLSAIIPETANTRKLHVSASTMGVTMKKVTFRFLTASNHNYIILSNRSLMKPAMSYPDVVKAYGGYRASAAGGGYDTLTISVDQVFDQFNYGEKSSRAIYQFMKYMDAGGDPKFFFIIGKGLEVSQGYYRKASFLPTDFHDLVPSAGIPGSDMAFTAGPTGEPAVPTGRLTASTPLQVAGYLNKVIDSEALNFDVMWRKDLLHLSGGINPGEPQLFRTYVDGFKAIADGFYLGGQTETISKQTLNVELINVKDQVNKGLNLITFYGHSGPGTIDIDIGYVSDPTLGYQNAGKYPGFLINGCNAGRFFDNRVTFGEDWMLTPNKGAKSFIAHSSFGFSNALRQYSEIFYQVAFGDSTYIHKGVGEVQKETARRYLAAYGDGTLSVTQVQQMVLLGDPAVQLFGANKPDYEVADGSALSVVSFDGNPITARTDSFALEIRVRNFGRAHPEPFKIRVQRTLSDNSVLTYDSLFNPVMYTQTIQFIIRRGPSESEAGNNLFTVFLDSDQLTAELREDNNEASLNFFIPINGSKNLFPAPYAIVPGSSVNLLFQHTNLTSDVRSFKVEVDTAATFDSPYLNRKTVSGKVTATLPLSMLPNDSLVYYWRTRLENPLPGENTSWTTSSFVHIFNGDEGWAQIKFPQLLGNDTTGLTWNRTTQRLEFLSTTSTVDILTYGSAHPSAPSGVSVKINQEEFNVASQGQPCRNNTLNLIAFDKHSTAPYAGIPFNFSDPRSCGREPQLINSYALSELELANGIAQYVANIQAGDSVVIFSIGDAGFASWSVATKLQLEQLGVGLNQLNGVAPGEPFVLHGKKGSAGGTADLFRPAGTPANAQALSVPGTITGRFSEGTLSSELIGPAQSWGALTTQVTGIAAPDVVSIDIVGMDVSGAETLIRTVAPGTQSVNDIDATAFPFMRLDLHVEDPIDLTAGQLRKWLVTFTPMAEGMLTYTGKLETDSVEEGEQWKAEYGFTNISNRNFLDSLTVRADVFSTTPRILDRKTFRIAAPAPGDTTTFEVVFETHGKGGANDVTVYVNPRVLPEQYYDNNLLPLYGHLLVNADLAGPVLDVTIDGRHVLSGDQVSRSPVIRAEVIDRNPFLLKTDTTGIDLFLRYPCVDPDDCPFIRIDFTNPDVVWTPASLTQEFLMEFKPVDLPTGTYTLQMNAVDAKGNASGAVPYELTFVVSDEQGFKLESVYPNPSTDWFYFKVVIGGEAPSDFLLEVFSSTGSSVRRFGNEALSSLHVGTNEFRISAQDAGGNPLPAGIYLFRMSALIGGRSYTQAGRLVVQR